MSDRMITLHNPRPAARPAPAGLRPAPRLDSLSGKFVGILNNDKPGAEVLLARLEKRLKEVSALSGSLWVMKHPGARIPEPMLKELSEKCDFVVNALGD